MQVQSSRINYLRFNHLRRGTETCRTMLNGEVLPSYKIDYTTLRLSSASFE
jgi:hypothetical protein